MSVVKTHLEKHVTSALVFDVGCRVPWEAPQSVVDLFNRCTAKYPADRPDIKEVVQVILLGFHPA